MPHATHERRYAAARATARARCHQARCQRQPRRCMRARGIEADAWVGRCSTLRMARWKSPFDPCHACLCRCLLDAFLACPCLFFSFLFSFFFVFSFFCLLLFLPAQKRAGQMAEKAAQKKEQELFFQENSCPGSQVKGRGEGGCWRLRGL